MISRRGPTSVICRVSGCQSELPRKAYYQRYRICCYHSTMPSLVLNGREQRWCQQCGRFHELEAFDGDKKTCRTKLNHHNTRRKINRSRARNLEDNLVAVTSQLSGVSSPPASPIANSLEPVLAALQQSNAQSTPAPPQQQRQLLGREQLQPGAVDGKSQQRGSPIFVLKPTPVWLQPQQQLQQQPLHPPSPRRQRPPQQESLQQQHSLLPPQQQSLLLEHLPLSRQPPPPLPPLQRPFSSPKAEGRRAAQLQPWNGTELGLCFPVAAPTLPHAAAATPTRVFLPAVINQVGLQPAARVCPQGMPPSGQGRQNVAPGAHTMGLPSVFADVPELRFDFPLEETLEAPDHSIAVCSAESELSEFLEAPPWSPKSGHPSWFTLFGELRWDGL